MVPYLTEHFYETIGRDHVVTPGVYGDPTYLSFVVAVGTMQLKFVRIERPMVTHKVSIDKFLHENCRRYDYEVDDAARRFLKTLPAERDEQSEEARAILEDLAGYTLLE